MKKLLLCTLLCFISITVLSQTQLIEEFRGINYLVIRKDVLLPAYDTMATVENEKSSISDIRKNAVYVSLDFVFAFSINYERMFPLSNKIKLGLRGGFGYGGGNKNLGVTGEGVFLYGRSKHFMEVGVGCYYPFHYFEEGPDSPLIGIMGGYRYQSSAGFLFKVYPMFLMEVSPVEDSWGNFPSLGFALGYSF